MYAYNKVVFSKEQGYSQQRVIVFVDFVSARKFEGYDNFLDGTCIELQIPIIFNKSIAFKVLAHYGHRSISFISLYQGHQESLTIIIV